MNELLEKYNDYMKIKNHRAEYALENGAIISFVYKEENFIHLLGLHKLKDIKIIQKFNDKSNLKVNAKYILRRIKKEIITDSVIKSSLFFNDISERYDNFTYEKLSTLVYTDVIINFNPSLVNSKIKSDYLFFEENTNKEYNHLGIAIDDISGNRYIETFFHEKTDMYICRQQNKKIKSYILYSPDNKIVFTDSF